MQMRTLYPLVAAALLVPLGSVAADETTTTSSHAPESTFTLAIDPREQWILPGATATFRVVAEGRAQTVLHLAARAPDGVVATLHPNEIALAPGQPGYATLTVDPGDALTNSPILLFVFASSATGESQGATAALYVRDDSSGPRPCGAYDNATTAPACYHPKPEPDRCGDADGPSTCYRPKPVTDARSDKPAPVDARPDLGAYERRADALERRIESILARVERAFARFDDREHGGVDKPAVRELNVPLPTMDVKLRLADDNVTLSSEGGRVALLIENNGREGRLRLQLDHDASGGWKVELEKEGVYLRPNERTYVWIHIDPGTRASVTYTLRAADASVLGVAISAAASIA